MAVTGCGDHSFDVVVHVLLKVIGEHGRLVGEPRAPHGRAAAAAEVQAGQSVPRRCHARCHARCQSASVPQAARMCAGGEQERDGIPDQRVFTWRPVFKNSIPLPSWERTSVTRLATFLWKRVFLYGQYHILGPFPSFDKIILSLILSRRAAPRREPAPYFFGPVCVCLCLCVFVCVCTLLE